MVVFFILLAIFVFFICVKLRLSYNVKVKSVIDKFLSSASVYSPLLNLNIRVQTNGKKISSSDKSHLIDFIILHNREKIKKALLLYDLFVKWELDKKDKLEREVLFDMNSISNNMLIWGNIFKKRCEKELKSLFYEYSSQNIRFNLSTFSHLSNTAHYNPNNGSWWYDETADKTTFSKSLTVDDILSRIKILAKTNFELTEYEYNCDNQRKLMTKKLRDKIIQRDARICQNCKKLCSTKEIEIDHIIPISKGGKTAESNLQVLCISCNRKKSNKLMEDVATLYIDDSKKHTSNIRLTTNIKRPIHQDIANIFLPNRVQGGDEFTIRYLDNDKKRTFILIEGESEKKLLGNSISINSPIGKAVLNRKILDIIDVTVPDGVKKTKNIKIEITDIKKGAAFTR